MSYSDPVKIIQQLPKDFDTKVGNHHQDQSTSSTSQQDVEPPLFTPPCETPPTFHWKLAILAGTLAVFAAAFLTGTLST